MTSVILGIFFIIAVSIWLIGCNSQVDDVTIRFVAVGSNGVVIYSTDGGKNWTEGTLGTQDNLFNLFGIATDGKGNWVTVGRDTLNINGIIRYSTDDGVSWNPGGPTINALYGGAIWAPGTNTSSTLTDVTTDGSGRWVAVGLNPGVGAIHYSDNVTTWNPGTHTPPEWLWGAATDGNGTWVAVGEGGYVTYSNDGGETWTSGSSNTTTDLFFVAVGP